MVALLSTVVGDCALEGGNLRVLPLCVRGRIQRRLRFHVVGVRGARSYTRGEVFEVLSKVVFRCAFRYGVLRRRVGVCGVLFNASSLCHVRFRNYGVREEDRSSSVVLRRVVGPEV